MASPSSQQHSRWIYYIVALAFIVLRTFFALAWDVAAAKDCSPFVNDVYKRHDGVNSVGLAKCVADKNYATVGHKADSYLILDMGVGNEIVDDSGIDFYFMKDRQVLGFN